MPTQCANSTMKQAILNRGGGWLLYSGRIFCALALVLAMASNAKEKMMRVVERDGRAYVSAKALAGEAGIAIKTLPGQQQVVACAPDRCALVKEFVREADDTLVAVAALSEALGATAEFDAKRQQVRFHFGRKSAPLPEALGRVG